MEMNTNRSPFFKGQGSRPYWIAGPCSAETEQQVLETAHGLKDAGIDLFRAGIWKPRTRPGDFEGNGSPALPWLQRVKEETGLSVCTEVANAQHAEEALRCGVDVLWIGARSTTNPFSVQEIADALQGVDIPVMVKNPINPDIKLWMGALERIERAGIKKVAVIHRGFSTFGKDKYRNQPRWQLAIELKRQFPDLAFICDSSHICGSREWLYDVSQKALDLNYDGIMLEVHPRPHEAWSDALQQITPDQYKEVKSKLNFRYSSTDDVDFLDSLEALRGQIDEIDDEILALLEARMKLCDGIGRFKKRNNIAILQTSRWSEILEKSIAKGQRKGLSSELISGVMKAVHQESINRQHKVMRDA